MQVGYTPKVVLSGRETNEKMGDWITEVFLSQLTDMDFDLNDIEVFIFGFTFKENCPDIRNTGTLNIVRSLNAKNIFPIIIDPRADKEEAKKVYKLEILNKIPNNLKNKAIIVSVPHDEFKGLNWLKIIEENVLICDIKGIIPNHEKGNKNIKIYS